MIPDGPAEKLAAWHLVRSLVLEMQRGRLPMKELRDLRLATLSLPFNQF